MKDNQVYFNMETNTEDITTKKNTFRDMIKYSDTTSDIKIDKSNGVDDMNDMNDMNDVNDVDDQDELIVIDRFHYDPNKMILTDDDRLDILRGENGFLTEDERLSRLFNYIKICKSYEFRKLLSEDNNVINQMFKNTYLLHEACLYGAVDIVTFLLFSDADCNLIDLNGMYPQHNAIQSKMPILIDILSVFGNDLNVKDLKGNTPLHHAVTISDKTIIHMLLNYKVEILQNNAENTPIDICDDLTIKNTLIEYQNKKI
jgi:hypothetical protein